MNNLLLTISFKGTNYHGFQIHKNALTISFVLQNALESILNHKTEIKGCSRTDSGVHANAYCLSFKTNLNIAPQNLIKALNSKLPRDIVAIDCQEVSPDFHARYSAKQKEYIYKIWNSEIPSPFLYDLTYHYKYKLDHHMLDKEAKDFIGKHNFRAFCNIKKGRNMNDCVRTIYNFDVIRDSKIVIFKVSGNGFLYNMVRIMVGTLIAIQKGSIKQGAISYILKQQDRSLAGDTFPAVGLYLNKVYY